MLDDKRTDAERAFGESILKALSLINQILRVNGPQ